MFNIKTNSEVHLATLKLTIDQDIQRQLYPQSNIKCIAKCIRRTLQTKRWNALKSFSLKWICLYRQVSFCRQEMKHREWSPKLQTTFVCFNTILSVIPSGQYMCLVIMKKESFVQNRVIAFLPSIIVLSVMVQINAICNNYK